MKKLNVENLTTKMNNIGVGLAREMNYVEKTHRTTGMYNKDDLDRISKQTWPIIDYITQFDYETRESYHDLLAICGWIILLCQTITKVIDEEV